MSTTARILIVGAGPTGLTAAVELARRGIVPDIIEKRANASNLSRAVGILPSSMEVWKESGVAVAIDQDAIPFKHFRLARNRRVLARIPLELPHSPYQRLLGLAQDRTEAHLHEGLERFGGQIEFGAELQTLVAKPSHVVVTINDEQREYHYVVGADGVRSTVRQQAGIEYRGFDLPERWSIADVDCADWHDADDFHVYACDNGRVVVVAPLEMNRFRVVSNTPDALATLPVPMAVTNVRRRDDFTISVRQAERYQSDRVFLAGDAAHCHSPVGGRGMNLGVSDAGDLARRLAEGGLEGYHDCRHPVGRKTIELSERGRRAITNQNGWVRAAVLTAIDVIAAVPPLRRRLVAALMASE